MLGLIKKIFMGLLISLVNAYNHTKCVSLSNQKCETQPTFINLHPNQYSQEFHFYPFTVKLDKYVGSCNTLNDRPNKVCETRFKLKRVQHDHRNNEWKTLPKHISCECKCKFDGRKCNSDG